MGRRTRRADPVFLLCPDSVLTHCETGLQRAPSPRGKRFVSCEQGSSCTIDVLCLCSLESSPRKKSPARLESVMYFRKAALAVVSCQGTIYFLLLEQLPDDFHAGCQSDLQSGCNSASLRTKTVRIRAFASRTADRHLIGHCSIADLSRCGDAQPPCSPDGFAFKQVVLPTHTVI